MIRILSLEDLQSVTPLFQYEEEFRALTNYYLDPNEENFTLMGYWVDDELVATMGCQFSTLAHHWCVNMISGKNSLEVMNDLFNACLLYAEEHGHYQFYVLSGDFVKHFFDNSFKYAYGTLGDVHLGQLSDFHMINAELLHFRPAPDHKVIIYGIRNDHVDS